MSRAPCKRTTSSSRSCACCLRSAITPFTTGAECVLCEHAAVKATPRDPAPTFEALLRVWEAGEPRAVLDLITEDYLGHMLHSTGGARTAADYPAWIERWRTSNPDTTFEIAEQDRIGSRLWSRLVARRPDGSCANGMNESRFEGERIAEEWAIWSDWQ